MRASASRLRTASFKTRYFPWCGPREIATSMRLRRSSRNFPASTSSRRPSASLRVRPERKPSVPRLMPRSGVPDGAPRATESSVPSPPRTNTRSVSLAIRDLATPSGFPNRAAVSASRRTRRPRRRSAFLEGRGELGRRRGPDLRKRSRRCEIGTPSRATPSSCSIYTKSDEKLGVASGAADRRCHLAEDLEAEAASGGQRPLRRRAGAWLRTARRLPAEPPAGPPRTAASRARRRRRRSRHAERSPAARGAGR